MTTKTARLFAKLLVLEYVKRPLWATGGMAGPLSRFTYREFLNAQADKRHGDVYALALREIGA